jgi:hypothetical protein
VTDKGVRHRPDSECKPASVWRKASRLHALIPREGERFGDLYRGPRLRRARLRTAQERSRACADPRPWPGEGRASRRPLLHARLRARKGASLPARRIESGRQDMAAQEDTAIIAGQLADLTRNVEQMADELKALGERADSQQSRADSQQERTEIQQERIDLAARELAEVSDRLQAAANALRESI